MPFVLSILVTMLRFNLFFPRFLNFKLGRGNFLSELSQGTYIKSLVEKVKTISVAFQKIVFLYLEVHRKLQNDIELYKVKGTPPVFEYIDRRVQNFTPFNLAISQDICIFFNIPIGHNVMFQIIFFSKFLNFKFQNSKSNFCVD